MNTSEEKKTWTRATLSIDWRADRHSESHSIEFERPTAENPSPEFPVVVGEILSTGRLDASSMWGSLFAAIKVEAFDPYSLTFGYGTMHYTIRLGEPFIAEKGMDYTTFQLHLGLH